MIVVILLCSVRQKQSCNGNEKFVQQNSNLNRTCFTQGLQLNYGNGYGKSVKLSWKIFLSFFQMYHNK